MPNQPNYSQWSEIDRELLAGRKIQAIKLYRAATGCDLKAAVDAVESRQPGGATSAAPAQAVGALTEKQWQPIDELVLAGQKIQAIKIYREVTGTGLAEAKDAVEARDRDLAARFPTRNRQPKRGGCLPAVLLLVAGALVPLAALVLKTGR